MLILYPATLPDSLISSSSFLVASLGFSVCSIGASLVAQLVKNLPAVQEKILVRFLSWEDLLEKGYTTHPSILGLPLWLSW